MTGFPVGAAVTVAELERDPHAALARLRAAEPVSWLPALDGWLVSRRDLVLEVLRDPTTFTVDDPRFSTARVVGPSMLSLDGGAHGRHRGPFVRAFRPADVRTRFADFVRTEADRLVCALRPGGAAELRRGLAGPLAVATVAESLGLVGAEPSTVLGWYDAIVGAVNALTAGEPAGPASPAWVAGEAAFARLRSGVEATLDQRESGSLLVAAADGGLDRAETVSNAAVLMFGGIETTEGMIANLVFHLLSSPDQLALVRADRALAADAVEESLRLEPAAAVVDRYAACDVELAGVPIRRGDLVVASLAGANRDPDVFAEPDRFDVRRASARQHLAFGHGSHYCLGTELARLEAYAALDALLDQLPDLHLDPDRPTAPRGLVFRKPPHLHVRWSG